MPDVLLRFTLGSCMLSLQRLEPALILCCRSKSTSSGCRSTSTQIGSRRSSSSALAKAAPGAPGSRSKGSSGGKVGEC